ncbi:hypothetical protein N7533_005239 [Penicillium manginii]|uniref:uncharacterized protein n=1 Tax=Penicillium manginii TaxID=203109 RepID=UPI0025493CFA|nr:uncharacterized protein N7533_005239 [Penicillium manginii]KAJ5755696.1 hypothetical protein N7533_005239 [Penicillium manginii]
MPVCTLHLLAFNQPTNPQSYIQELQKSTKTWIKPPLATENWDLLLLLQPNKNTTDPIPTHLRTAIKSEYKIPTGIPSKLLANYTTRNKALQEKSASTALTGSLEKHLSNSSKPSSQNLEISPSLVSFMNELSETHPGPVTMLNLLHFQQPTGKQSYYQYGQAFVPVAGKRGGDAKLVGNVVVTPQLQPQQRDSKNSSPESSCRGDGAAEGWWDEISLVHYPSIRHFCDMLAGDDYQAINEKYRLSALRDTFLLCTTELNLEGVSVGADSKL